MMEMPPPVWIPPRKRKAFAIKVNEEWLKMAVDRHTAALNMNKKRKRLHENQLLQLHWHLKDMKRTTKFKLYCKKTKGKRGSKWFIWAAHITIKKKATKNSQQSQTYWNWKAYTNMNIVLPCTTCITQNKMNKTLGQFTFNQYIWYDARSWCWCNKLLIVMVNSGRKKNHHCISCCKMSNPFERSEGNKKKLKQYPSVYHLHQHTITALVRANTYSQKNYSCWNKKKVCILMKTL